MRSTVGRSMKLSSLCPAPCFAHAGDFEIASPGCSASDLNFGRDEGRSFFAVLLRNHRPEALPQLNPKLAIVGLSPGANQITSFLASYQRTGDYGQASVDGAFAGLAGRIIAMFAGVGLSAKLNLRFPQATSLARHPDVYVTSLVACATLDASGGSDSFNPCHSPAASRCITLRLTGELTNPAFTRLSHIVVLGEEGWKALDELKVADGQSVVQSLRGAGKQLIRFPHPSGQNGEFVKLASLPADQMPNLEAYVAAMWEGYRWKPARPGRGKDSEVKYKAKRRTVWESVQGVRDAIARSKP